MKKYSKRVVNVTYSDVTDKVQVRTYPCIKFGSYDGTPLTQTQKDTLRARMIHLVIFKDATKMSGQRYKIHIITKKGQWGSDILENIVKDVMKKDGDFNLADETRHKAMMKDIENQVRTYNKTMMGLIPATTPKVVRDPKTGRFMKATA